jgi:high-affinity nickel-transport protein
VKRDSLAALRLPRGRLLLLGAVITLLHVGGVLVIMTFSDRRPGLVGLAVLAYTLGLRHAFDADHIAAIDNTTRKLRQDGQRPVAVGFFFAAGHSSVVLMLTLIAATITHAVPDISGTTGFVGSSAAGLFLWIVGVLNLFVLVDTLRVARRIRAGERPEALVDDLLLPAGILTRLGLGRVLGIVSRSWQMLPVGLLFGLGFETATEITLLALGASAAGSGLPLIATMALPLLFAAGMTLMDTLDGLVMARAYDWALRRPARKILYNLVITALSVVVALTVGTLQLANVAIDVFDLHGGAWESVASIDLQELGYGIAALFVATWLTSILVWRSLRLEDHRAIPQLALVENDDG